MNRSQFCPRCESRLPVGAPAGLCPKCLLAAGLNEMGTRATRTQSPAASLAGLMFVPPEPHELAQLFPQLEILELVGRGGMGAVYKARQPHLDRSVAIKILPPEVGQDPTFAERFAREARALARLSHPNIVAVYDFGQTGGLYYFIMEFVDGANLRTLIQNGHMQPKEALAIVPQICEALQFAHDEGIVHRDIKPENILVDKRGRVRIADFGLAKLLGGEAADSHLTATHQVLGTMHYMAPEQFQGFRGVDHRADIYSLGVVFYEMLTGQLPLGRFDPPSRKAEVDARLDDVVLRSLEAEPDRRYQQASQVKTDLQSLAQPPLAPTFQESHQESQKNSYAEAIPSISETWIPPEDYFFTPADQRLREQLALPSTLLLLSALLDLVGLVVMLSFGQRDFAMPGLIGIRSALFFIIACGALRMRRLQDLRLARAACVFAMLPVSLGWVLGLIAGPWLLALLARLETVNAFERHAAKRQAAQLSYRILLLIALSPLLIVLLSIVLTLSWLRTEREAYVAQPTVPPRPEALTPDNAVEWSNGLPQLGDAAIQALRLVPIQEGQLNEQLRKVFARYLEEEVKHTERSITEAGHQLVTIQAFTKQIKGLDSEFWTNVDPILSDDDQRRQARTFLRPALDENVFPFHAGLNLEMWRSGTFYAWEARRNVAVLRGGPEQFSTFVTSDEDAQLPEEYQRFWQE